jgi:signal transduction histidine kinase/ActR/RegA family two-component response regulator
MDVAGEAFLAGGGEMGARIRAFDWTATPLGPPSGWSPPLRTVLRILLTTGHPVFVFWGREHICLYNDAYSRSLGPEKHPAILGARGRDAWPEIWPIIGPQIEQVLSGRGATWHENHLVPIRRHGVIEDVYWTYSYGPIDDADAPGGIGGVLVLCTETTPQVVAEHKLRAAEEAQRSEREALTEMLEALPVLIARYEPSLASIWLNQAFTTTLGWDASDARDATLMEKCYPDPVVRAQAEAFMASAPGEWRVFPTCARDGSTRRVAWTNLALTNGLKVGVGVDLSERLDAEDALAEANAMLRAADRRKNEFLALLAHELRGPLAPLKTAAVLLRRSGLDRTRAEQVAGIVTRQVEVMSRLTEELSDVTRITSGKLDLTPAPMDVRTAIARAVEVVQPIVNKRAQTLAVTLADHLPLVLGDELRLTQVLTNLLTNAAKYTPPGGWIRVEARHEPDVLCLSVEDSGIGLAADQLEQVFEAFIQTDAARQFAPGGLGLGLALSRSLVELHGGTLIAASAGLNRGCTFTVRLPSAPRAAVAVEPDARPTRVLIADDNTDVAEQLAEVARALGAQVEVVYDGAAALDRERSFEPDVVVLHDRMPGLDGPTIARTLRARGRPVRLVAVSASATSTVGADDSAAFDAWLQKPVDPAALAAAIGRPRSAGAPGTPDARLG